MTDSLFFDTDCISAFLWVNSQSLLAGLYPGRVVIPRPVYDELSYPITPHLKQRIDYLINNKLADLAAIDKGMLFGLQCLQNVENLERHHFRST